MVCQTFGSSYTISVQGQWSRSCGAAISGPRSCYSNNVECESKSNTDNNRIDLNFITINQYLSNIPRKHEVEELKKIAVLGTAHKLRKVIM
jgi:hypothetical protein